MPLARRLLETLLIVGLAMGSASAQTIPGAPGYGIFPNPADQNSQQQQTTPLRTPVITNAPVSPTGVQEQDLQQLRQQYREQVPQQQQQFQQRGLPQTPFGTPSEAPPEKNEFQTFIYNSTGQRLPLFGYNLFEGTPSTFAPV
ncbi:MAG: hypothetical protein ACREVC_14270, partial [Burkholderiales bacterium]